MQTKKMPDNTKIFCTHEYTMCNLQFIKDEKANFPATFLKKISYTDQQIENLKDYQQARLNKTNATVPLDLRSEISSNPYLNCDTIEEFLAICKLKDQY